jgi:hypothetical protein
MNLYIIIIAALALSVVFLFCKWLYAKSCVEFWNMMYREEQRHNEQLFSRLKRLEDRYMLPSNSIRTQKHEPVDGKALAEDPAPYYALDMMARDKEGSEA